MPQEQAYPEVVDRGNVVLIDHAAGEGDAAYSTARAQVVTLHLINQYIVPCINVKNLTLYTSDSSSLILSIISTTVPLTPWELLKTDSGQYI